MGGLLLKLLVPSLDEGLWQSGQLRGAHQWGFSSGSAREKLPCSRQLAGIPAASPEGQS